MFWLKCRARWRERPPDDSAVANAGPNSDVVLVLPDNNRDPELTQGLQDAQEKYFGREAPARAALVPRQLIQCAR